MNILIINGPNINFLGIREPEIYGKETYADLKKYLKNLSHKYKIKIKIYQSNYEGALIDYIQKKYQKFDAIIINPGALSHYSYALYDCLKAVKTPSIEVHLSNPLNREEFRKKLVISDACVASFMGSHFESYHNAIKFIMRGFKHE